VALAAVGYVGRKDSSYFNRRSAIIVT
jgi:hypothetical protein